MDNYAVYIFDCDGVILNSNPVKSVLFYRVAAKYGEEIGKKLLDYHQANAGISRFQKFRYLHKELLDGKHQAQYESDLEEFCRLAPEAVKRAPLIPGIREYLESLAQTDSKLFVSSGSEQNELRSLLKANKLDHFFEGIFGSPDSKYDHLKNLGIDLSHAVFFGDGKSDYEAATAFDLDFVFVYGASEFAGFREFFADKDVDLIKDFTGLQK